MEKDFTATAEKISMHGLGFIQVKLPANKRLHVWHPDLPRRSCFEHSAIHNHRFSFRSHVLIGTQINFRYRMIEDDLGDYDIVSHDGPRSPFGGRESFVAGRANMQLWSQEAYWPGDSYEMAELEYHATPNSGIVVTLMEKLTEGSIHASSTIRHGHEFDQGFNRFQLTEAQLWGFVTEALAAG